MALDGTFLLAVKQELEPLIGGRIDKIHQPSKDEIVIAIRTREGGSRLLISASGNSGRIHLTRQQIENPQSPPMFCMLLRKRLGCGKLTAVRQDGLERILYLDFETVNELGDVVTVTLAAEIMGKYSNLIMIDGNGRIIDAVKRTDDAVSRERLILPGAVYVPPERGDRLNFLIASREEMKERIMGCRGKNLDRCLVSIFEGISPVLAREWIFTAAGRDISSEELTAETAEKITERILLTRDEFFTGRRRYTVIKDRQGNLKDFCFVPITQYGELMDTFECGSAGETLDMFYSERDRTARMKQRYHDLYKTLENAAERVRRRTENQKAELKISEERDILKLKGDLISANLWAVEKGMSSFKCVNFYDEKGGEIIIELDPRLTPSQNMQKFYSGYRKADNAEKRLRVLIDEGEKELIYIDSVRDALERAQTEGEAAALRDELAEQGYVRAQKGAKQKPPKAAPPIEYTSPEGFKILVGRNNRQNDQLTCKVAEKTDIWLHTKDITGSHVIIRAEGREVPEETILFAARAAALHSSAANSSNVPVDYVKAKFVKKPAGAKPGMVIFTNNRTVYVDPLEVIGQN
ncbi:MAG: NFACT family protein [Oscillospiraceae bacterium]|nr:NFACT family protein [Oscillospiraceae bacterium]